MRLQVAMEAGLVAGDLAPVYPMGVVERMTGLSRRQIRYYEAAGLLQPGRTGGGHRLFCDREVRTLLRIKLLRDSGLRTMAALAGAIRTGVGAGPVARGDVMPRFQHRRLVDRSDVVRTDHLVGDAVAHFRRQHVLREHAPSFTPAGGPQIGIWRGDDK